MTFAISFSGVARIRQSPGGGTAGPRKICSESPRLWAQVAICSVLDVWCLWCSGGPCAVKRVGRETVGFPETDGGGRWGVPELEYRFHRISSWWLVRRAKWCCCMWLLAYPSSGQKGPVVDGAGSWSDIAPLDDTRASCLKSWGQVKRS